MDESLNRSLSREEAKKNFKNARQRVDVASSNRTKRKAKDNATFGRNVLGAVTNTLGVDLADSAAVTETSSARPPRYSEQAESKQYPKGKSKAVNAKSKTQTAKCDKNGATVSLFKKVQIKLMRNARARRLIVVQTKARLFLSASSSINFISVNVTIFLWDIVWAS